MSFLCEKSGGKIIAWRKYSDIWRAILWGQFLFHGKVHLVFIWYPKKFRLKIKLILSLARFYICLDKFWTWESKNDLDVQHSKLHKYTEDMSLPRVVLEWKAQVFFSCQKIKSKLLCMGRVLEKRTSYICCCGVDLQWYFAGIPSTSALQNQIARYIKIGMVYFYLGK